MGRNFDSIKRLFVIGVVVFSCLQWIEAAAAEGLGLPEVKLTERDRILILVPHPDDEVLGCAGIIQKAVAMGLPLRIVFLTYGDSNEWSFMVYRKRPVVMPKAVERMGLVRHDEAIAAARVLGLSPDHLTFLGYPDLGTLKMWESHWRDRPPLRSVLTEAKAVPYPDALRPGAPYKGEDVLRDLTTVLREFRPTKVFVSHPTDLHPDHRALYLFTRVALWDLEDEVKPQLYCYLVHHWHWPEPRGYHPAKPLEPPLDLKEGIPWQVSPLSPKEADRKQLALKAHKTQYEYSGKYLLSFARSNELFADSPVVKLRTNDSSVPRSSGGNEHLETREELTDLERASFVGLEWRFVRLEDENLVLSIELSRPLAKEVEVSVYVFGYRTGRPFAQMPKLHVRLGMLGYKVYDQKKKLSKDKVRVSRSPKEITIRVPLEVLASPERILTSARTYLGEVPMDRVSWVTLDLSASP